MSGSATKVTSASEAIQAEETGEPSLSKLVSALAVGARAVQPLPIGGDFDFQSVFPEFSRPNADANESLVQLLRVVLQDSEVDDPMIWEKCADLCESLLEQAESYAVAGGGVSSTPEALQNVSALARQKAKGGYGRMMQNLVAMDKPQDTYSIRVQNDRTQPFIPRVHPEKPYGKMPLSLELKDGHGLESRFYGTTRTVPANIVAPSQHVPHVYQEELLSLQYLPGQLKGPETRPPSVAKTPDEKLTAIWVDTREELAKLAQCLESVDLVAVDLEAHSYRSFAGLTCLMQMTVQHQDDNRENYLVDTLKLWHDINPYLAPFFANPSKVKVMHGADSDVQWLQRDFGIYIVNMFDTGRAARALPHPSAGLAHLLRHFVGIEADKSLALSDWRRRPLLNEMRIYAIMDTHYLLDIYQHLLFELELHPETSVEQVLVDSRNVCLIRYDKDPFQPDGYKSIRSPRRMASSESAPSQEVLASLFDWRDSTARACDESIQYVCSNQALLRISVACPTTVVHLQSLYNPMPPLVMRFAQEILFRIKRCLESDDDSEIASPQRGIAGAPSSAYFKPAEVDDTEVDDEPNMRGDPFSPVLLPEEMYKQAGWLTPHGDVVSTTTDEDDGDSSSKPRKLLAVDAANTGYQANENTTHSLAMSKQCHTVDGLGSARASSAKDERANVNADARRAQLNAARIRSGMSQEKALLGSVSAATKPGAEGVPALQAEVQTIGKAKGDSDSGDEEFVIPKSVAEIYKISNQNRRNRNSVSPTNLERSGVAPEQMEVDTPAGAEAIIAASGYYAGGLGGKRQRTKSSTGEKGASGPSREENIEFMKDLGWIKNKEELESKMIHPQGEDAAAADNASHEGVDRESPTGASRTSKGSSTGNKSSSPVDFSSVGPIGVYPASPASANPFFGVAPVLTSHTGMSKRSGAERKKGTGRGKSGRGGKQERPEKKDGRTFAYKKR